MKFGVGQVFSMIERHKTGITYTIGIVKKTEGKSKVWFLLSPLHYNEPESLEELSKMDFIYDDDPYYTGYFHEEDIRILPFNENDLLEYVNRNKSSTDDQDEYVINFNINGTFSIKAKSIEEAESVLKAINIKEYIKKGKSSSNSKIVGTYNEDGSINYLKSVSSK